MNVRQQYWNSKEFLQKSGALDKPIVPNDSSLHTNSQATSSRKYIQGWTQTIPLQAGHSNFKLDFDANKIVGNTLSVYRNGGEALADGRDYHIDKAANTITLVKAAKTTDDDLEIRCQINNFDDYVILRTLLLPRQMGYTTFTDDQLMDLLPNAGDIFEVDKLLKYGNVKLINVAGKKLEVLEAEIADAGILGKMLIK